MTTQTFEYNAPQFVDFNSGINESDDDADTFFDVEESPKVENKENEPAITNMSIKQEVSPVKYEETSKLLHTIKEEVTSPTETKPDSSKKRVKKVGVRRLSADKKIILSSGLPYTGISKELCQKIDKMTIKEKKRTTYFEGIPVTTKEEKAHSMMTRNDTAAKTPTIELRTRVVNKEAENRKRKSTSRFSEMPGKYMAMAESILHFQKDTPPRFHSSSRRSTGARNSLLKARMSYKAQRTVPLTPRLTTAVRALKRTSSVLSLVERENLEIEEMKKHQVKAMPLNDKVLKPPEPLHKSEKLPTVQEPFKLTEVFKKPLPKAKEEAFVFTAKPVPRALLDRPLGVAPKVELPITVPVSPAITKSSRSYKPPVRIPALTNDNSVVLEELYGFGVPCNKNTRPKNTEVKPFSFEERDKEMFERKERKKQEILLAEKKAREFKAKPIPGFVHNSSRSSHLDCSKISTTSTHVEETKQPFKARSPRVLRKSPFKPHLEHAHSQPHELTLNTERRINERREFEIKQLLKEERLAFEKEQMELEKKRKEEEEIARLRQEAVHKARPMPKFKPPPTFSNNLPLTEPKSPRFSKRNRNNEMHKS